MTPESIAYLRARLGLVESRVRALVEARRRTDPEPDDSFRGLYVSDQQADRMLSQPGGGHLPGAPVGYREELTALEAWAAGVEAAGVELRLRRLARSFGLDGMDVEILLIALAPDLDARFERLYGYLNDDVSRRRACIGLALDLLAVDLRNSSQGAETLGRFHAQAPLCIRGLLIVEETDRPLLTRPLRVPDRVTAHLLGDDRPDPSLSPYLVDALNVHSAAVDRVGAALLSGARIIYVREPSATSGFSTSASALLRTGLRAVAVDVSSLSPPEELSDLVPVAVREATLAGGGLVVGPIDFLVERGANSVHLLANAACPVILLGSRSWDPLWSERVPVVVDLPPPGPEDRTSYWKMFLNGRGPEGPDLTRATGLFRLSPEQVRRAATFAVLKAAAEGEVVAAEHVQAGARAQNAGALERLTRRIEPAATWADLVLPDDALAQLHELAERARLSDQVLGVWNGGPHKGRGVAALFAGESGTGKTMSAEILAHELGLDLYVIDLSTVIDKYVGETEKNLERIFVEADRVNAVLLFDEADAIFGKRSEVQDAHDRYANVETAYLLQRIERFDGLAILTTNLRSNVDEAFTRRLDAIIDFPNPQEADRRRLWQVHLDRGMAVEGGLDLEFLARSFKVSGGNIANIVLGAAFLAAHEQVPIGMAHLIRATEREYRKLGHLCVPEEFGPYYQLIARAAGV